MSEPPGQLEGLFGLVLLFIIGALLFMAGAVAGGHIVLGGERAPPKGRGHR
jgi:hypothetical protein